MVVTINTVGGRVSGHSGIKIVLSHNEFDMHSVVIAKEGKKVRIL